MRGLFASVAVSVMVAAAPMAQAETLADALAKAYVNSQLLDQNEALLRAADEDVAQAVAATRPVLQFVAQRTWEQTDLPTTAPTTSLSNTVSLVASWTIYDFGRSQAGVEIAKESVLATREALKALEQQVLLSAVSAYVDVQLQSEIVALRQSNVRLISQELQAANDRFEVGEVTRTDVALAEAAQAQSHSALVAAQGDLAVARERYKAVTGAYPGQLAALPKLPATARSVDEARAIALKSNPGLLQAQRGVTLARLGVQAAKAARRPTLSGSVTGAVVNPNISASRVEDITAKLQLSQTLYAGGAVVSAQRQALANQEAAQAALVQAGIDVAETVGNAWSALDVANASITASSRQITAAQTAFDGVREEAKLGARTTLDVLDAEQNLLDARAGRLTVEAQRYVGTYSLLAAMGLLTVDHLNLGVPIYDPATYYNAVKSAPPIVSVQGKALERIAGKVAN